MNVVIVQQAVEQAQDVADVEKAQQRINKVQKEVSQQVLPQLSPPPPPHTPPPHTPVYMVV